MEDEFPLLMYTTVAMTMIKRRRTPPTMATMSQREEEEEEEEEELPPTWFPVCGSPAMSSYSARGVPGARKTEINKRPDRVPSRTRACSSSSGDSEANSWETRPSGRLGISEKEPYMTTPVGARVDSPPLGFEPRTRMTMDSPAGTRRV